MKPARDPRNKQLGLIHMGAAALGMDTADANPESEYRSLLWTLGRVRSAKDLDFAGRRRLLEHLHSRGAFGKWQPSPAAMPRSNPEWGWVDRAAEDRRPMLKKIIMLAKDGGYSKKYVDGTCVNMFGIERLELVGQGDLHKLISALVKDQQRRARAAMGA